MREDSFTRFSSSSGSRRSIPSCRTLRRLGRLICSKTIAGVKGRPATPFNLYFYYGAADSCVALATGSIRALLSGWTCTPALKTTNGRPECRHLGLSLANGHCRPDLAPRHSATTLDTRVCPLCSSYEFKEAESSFLDRPLNLFSLRPVRCVNCWRRYYWFAMKSIDKR
jgi:hypothetical protein